MPEYSNLFVVLMGLGTVFAGLLCIILLVTLMSWVCARTSAPKTVCLDCRTKEQICSRETRLP